MRTIDLLIGLHCDVFRTLLSDWVDVADLVSLDSAICNTSMRPFFLEVLSAVRLRSLQTPLWKSYERFLTWVLKRGVFSTDLTIRPSLNEMFWESFLTRIGAHVKAVELEWADETNTDKNILILISLYCKNLVKLSYSSSRNLLSISDVLRECTHLSELHLTARSIGSLKFKTFYPRIVECGSLMTVICYMDEQVVYYILKCIPYVRCLVLSVVDETIASYMTRFKNLLKFSIRNGDIEDDTLVQIAQGCPQIEHLDLSFCQHLTDAAVTAALKSLRALRSLGLEYTYINCTIMREIALCHSASLQAFYSPFYAEPSHVEFLVRHCPHLHTLRLNIGMVADFKLIDCAVFGTIRKLILCGAFQEYISRALALLAPHCPKLEFLGLRPVNVYDPNYCTGLAAVVKRCTCLRYLEFCCSGREEVTVSLCAVVVAAWGTLRPHLQIRYHADFSYDEDPLGCNVREM